MVLGFLFGMRGARNDQECGKVIEREDGVVASDGEKCYKLAYDEKGYCIEQVATLGDGKARLPVNISEAALVEYAQIEKSFELDYPLKAVWVVSLLNGLARLQRITKVLYLRTEEVYEDAEQWFHGRLHSRYHVIVCLWSWKAVRCKMNLYLDEETGMFGMEYEDTSYVYRQIHAGLEVQYKSSDMSRTSLEEVLPYLSIVKKDAVIDNRSITFFQGRFLENPKRRLARQIRLAIVAEENSRNIQKMQVEHHEMGGNVARLENLNTLLRSQISELQEENAKLAGERESVQKELARFRISAGRAAVGDSKNVANGSASRFPSTSDVLIDWRQVGEKFSEFYDDLNLNGEVKVRFARSTFRVLKRMYENMDRLYKERLNAMLHGLGDLEKIETLTRATEDAFNVYCRRHWEELFVNAVPKSAASMSTPLREKRTALSEKERRNEVGLVAESYSLRNRFAERQEMVRNEGVLEDERMSQGEQENPGCPADSGATPFSLSELVIEFLQGVGDEKVSQDGENKEKLQNHFKLLWRATVAMYLQRPVVRLDFNSQVEVPFSGKHHDYVYKTPKKGEKVLLVVPAPFKAPNSFSVFSSGSDSGWVMVGKGFVDTFGDD